MKVATDEAYRRFPDPHDANLGSTRYGFIEGALWAGREIERLTAENERLLAVLEPFVRGLNMYERGTCVTENVPPPADDEPAKNVYVGDQRNARIACQQTTLHSEEGK